MHVLYLARRAAFSCFKTFKTFLKLSRNDIRVRAPYRRPVAARQRNSDGRNRCGRQPGTGESDHIPFARQRRVRRVRQTSGRRVALRQAHDGRRPPQNAAVRPLSQAQRKKQARRSLKLSQTRRSGEGTVSRCHFGLNRCSALPSVIANNGVQ